MVTEEKNCSNCMSLKRGECCGGKKSVCEFFKYSPSVNEGQKKNWPKYGDATAIRLGIFRK